MSRPSTSSERLTRLARVAAELQSARDLQSAHATSSSRHLADAAGATTASLVGARRRRHAGAGRPPRRRRRAPASRWATFPVDDSTPAGRGRAHRATAAARRPGRDRGPVPGPGARAPRASGRCSACRCVIGDRTHRRDHALVPRPAVDIDDAELEFYRIMADSCAQALDRIRALETVEDQHAKLALPRRGERRARQQPRLRVDPPQRRLAGGPRPRRLVLDLARAGRRPPARSPSRTATPTKVALGAGVPAALPHRPGRRSAGATRCCAPARAILVPEVTDEMLVRGGQRRGAPRDDPRPRPAQRALTVAAARPRTGPSASSRWVNGETGRRFAPDDIPFGEDLARRAADRHRQRAAAQRAARDRRAAAGGGAPGRAPAARTAGSWRRRTRSAGRVDVGGDFYDVIPLQRRTGWRLSIGDVMGRGVDAAAAMAQIRAALRAFVAVDPDPRSRDDAARPALRAVPLRPARHLALRPGRPGRGPGRPRLRRPPAADAAAASDGTAASSRRPDGTILGVRGRRSGPSTVAVPTPGQTLLLFTDGLLERRGRGPRAEQGAARSRRLHHAAGRPDRSRPRAPRRPRCATRPATTTSRSWPPGGSLPRAR